MLSCVHGFSMLYSYPLQSPQKQGLKGLADFRRKAIYLRYIPSAAVARCTCKHVRLWGDSFCLMSAPIHSSAVPCLPLCVNREVFGYSGMDANFYSIKFFSGTLRSTGLMSPQRKASISFLSVQRPRAIIVRTTRASVVRSPAGITPSFRARTPTSY